MDPVLIQEHARFVAGELGDLHVDLAEEGDHPRAQSRFRRGDAADLLLHDRLLRLVEREGDQHRLEREELIGLQDVQLFRGKILVAQRLLLLEESEAFLEDRQFFLHQLVVPAPDLFVNLLDTGLHNGHVGENELGLERRHIAQRIDPAVRVRYRVVPEKADHLNQGVVVLHGGEKTGGELRSAAGSLLQSGHVDELDAGVHGALRGEERRASIEPLIGHLHDAEVRVRLRHRGGVEMSFRDRLKERRLARKRKSDDAELHDVISCGTRRATGDGGHCARVARSARRDGRRARIIYLSS